jgi:SHS2 domain-containing protein
VNVLVKAVTYHGLHVRREGQVWAAQMIFDV